MRDLRLDEPAALVYCPFRALLHLPTWADRRRVFERVAASLRPDGRFAWNAFAFDHRVAVRLDGVSQERPVPHTVRYAVGENRVDVELEDGGRSSLWWATKNEWLGLVDVAGLVVEALYGGFDRRAVRRRQHRVRLRRPAGLTRNGQYSSFCGRPSVISNHGAFDPTKMCSVGRNPARRRASPSRRARTRPRVRPRREGSRTSRSGCRSASARRRSAGCRRRR